MRMRPFHMIKVYLVDKSLFEINCSKIVTIQNILRVIILH